MRARELFTGLSSGHNGNNETIHSPYTIHTVDWALVGMKIGFKEKALKEQPLSKNKRLDVFLF
jgi:hypothetical protein